MAEELEKARVTELHVRMNCNGCVRRIKKAMHDVDGVYKVYVDFAQQKVTVLGRADPEKILRAMKKTRRIATICSHIEPGEPSGSEQPSTEPVANDGIPEAPATEAAPSAESPKDAPPEENSAPEVKPSPEAEDAAPSEPKRVDDVGMIHYYPHSYIYSDHWNNFSSDQPYYEVPSFTIHGHNNYQPSAYVSEFGYLRSLTENRKVGRDENQIASMLSEENPNACRIV